MRGGLFSSAGILPDEATRPVHAKFFDGARKTLTKCKDHTGSVKAVFT